MTVRHISNPIRLVQEEIQQALEEAAGYLDAYEDNEDAAPPWGNCRDLLEQVRGALIMIDLQGAIRLCDEAIALTDALENNTALSREHGLDLLMHGMLLIPRYVYQARQHQRELPETLLPMINALRGLRRVVFLPDYQFFEIDPGRFELPDPLTDKGPSSELEQSSRRLRHMYQLGLLGLFRNPLSTVHAKEIQRALRRLSTLCGNSAHGRWFGVAAEVVDEVVQESRMVSPSMRLTLGRLDFQIRQLVRQGSRVATEQPPEFLRRALLYYVAACESDGTPLADLRDQLDLTAAITPDHVVDAERQSMAAPDGTVMEAVGKAMGEELDKLKGNIENFSRLSSITETERADLVARMHDLAHTLTLIGLSEAAANMKRQVTRLQSLPGTAEPRRIQELMAELADALSWIEENVQGLGAIRPRTAPERRVPRLLAAEHQVIEECNRNLGHVRGVLEYFNGDLDNGSELSTAGTPLDEARGSLIILGHTRAAAILERARREIDRLPPDQEQAEDRLILIADALAAVQWYLEGMLEDGEASDDVLKLAEESMGALGHGRAKSVEIPTADS